MISVEIQTLVERRLGVPFQGISEFCQRWEMIEVAVFGSVVRSDFCCDRDLDLLAIFGCGESAIAILIC